MGFKIFQAVLFRQLASADPFPTHHKDTEATGFTLRNLSLKFSTAPLPAMGRR